MTIRTRFEELEAAVRTLQADFDLMKAEIRDLKAGAAPKTEEKTEPAKGAAKGRRKAAGPA